MIFRRGFAPQLLDYPWKYFYSPHRLWWLLEKIEKFKPKPRLIIHVFYHKWMVENNANNFEPTGSGVVFNQLHLSESALFTSVTGVDRQGIKLPRVNVRLQRVSVRMPRVIVRMPRVNLRSTILNIDPLKWGCGSKKIKHFLYLHVRERIAIPGRGDQALKRQPQWGMRTKRSDSHGEMSARHGATFTSPWDQTDLTKATVSERCPKRQPQQ